MIKISLVFILLISMWAEDNYDSYYIKDSGKKVIIQVKKNNLNKIVRTLSKKNHQETKQGKKFSNDVEILVKFSKDINIDNFTAKHELKLIRKMVTGHYIFINQSKYTPMDLIKKIIDEESIVLSIFPNWQLNMKKN